MTTWSYDVNWALKTAGSIPYTNVHSSMQQLAQLAHLEVRPKVNPSAAPTYWRILLAVRRGCGSHQRKLSSDTLGLNGYNSTRIYPATPKRALTPRAIEIGSENGQNSYTDNTAKGAEATRDISSDTLGQISCNSTSKLKGLSSR